MASALRVLACTVPGAEPRLRAVLPDADLRVVFRSADAFEALRRESFDLVLVGIRFDESRALEIVRAMNADTTLRKPPIVGMRGARATYRASPEVFDLPMRAMGARDVIDFSDIPDDEAGNAAARDRLLRACDR